METYSRIKGTNLEHKTKKNISPYDHICKNLKKVMLFYECTLRIKRKTVIQKKKKSKTMSIASFYYIHNMNLKRFVYGLEASYIYCIF